MGSEAVRIGIAGWAIPAAQRERAAGEGTHLTRYARCFDAVEINSSFYRPHRRATYERWAGSVPEDFRFSVKAPRSITHECGLAGADAELERFAGEVAGLGGRLGVILIQLPASLPLERRTARRFFRNLRAAVAAAIVCEPRHASWFEPDVGDLLMELGVARAAADPARHAGADAPGGGQEITYTRLHGSPRMYYSSYGAAFLERIAARLRAQSASVREAWCIFDNTAQFAAWSNAASLQALMAASVGNV